MVFLLMSFILPSARCYPKCGFQGNSLRKLRKKQAFPEKTTEQIYEYLMKPHKHKHRKGKTAAGN